MSDRILVFIPCYNCALQIPRVLAQFNSVAARYVETILVLDNGSKDGTREAAIAAARTMPALDIKVARNRNNVNLGGSHKAAFAYALEHGYTHVIVLHGDDQGNILDMLPVLDRGDHRRLDACLGARFARGSKLVGYSAFRIFGNRVFNTIFTLALRRRVLDLGAGLNIFGVRVMRSRYLQNYADDLRFNVYLLMGMFHDGLEAEFFPISWREDDQISNVKMTSQAVNTLRMLRDRIFSSRAFWQADHREVKHAEYKFDVLYPEPGKAAV